MKEDTKNDFAPNFPYPYEHFGKELEAAVRELHDAVKQKDSIDKELQKALNSIKNVSPFHLNYKGHLANVEYYQSESRNIDDKINGLTKKTYGQMEAILSDHEADEKLSKQVTLAIDEKVYPDYHKKRVLDKESQKEKDIIRDENKDNLPVDGDNFQTMKNKETTKDKTLEDFKKVEKSPADNLHLNYKNYGDKIKEMREDFSKNKTDIELEPE